MTISLESRQKVELTPEQVKEAMAKAQFKIELVSYTPPKPTASPSYGGRVTWKLVTPIKVGNMTVESAITFKSPLFYDENRYKDGKPHIRTSEYFSWSGIDQGRKVVGKDNNGNEKNRYFNDVTGDNVILSYVDSLVHEQYADKIGSFAGAPEASEEDDSAESQIDDTETPETNGKEPF